MIYRWVNKFKKHVTVHNLNFLGVSMRNKTSATKPKTALAWIPGAFAITKKKELV